MLDKKLISWIGSVNFTPSRTETVNKIIIHWIVGNLKIADRVFKDADSRVSAHYAIEDKTIHQYVDEGDTAWHAKIANPFSIGIEHSAEPGRDATSMTLETSAMLIADICIRHKLDPIKAIQPHSKYVRTQCPGTIDIEFLRKRASEIIHQDSQANSR